MKRTTVLVVGWIVILVSAACAYEDNFGVEAVGGGFIRGDVIGNLYMHPNPAEDPRVRVSKTIARGRTLASGPSLSTPHLNV